MSPRRPALLLPALACNVVISSGTFLIAKSALHDFPPLVLALFRFTLAAALLWPAARLLQPGRRIAHPDRARIWLLGILAVPLNQGLFLVGMQWASASHAALLYALTPAFLIGIAALRGSPPTMRQVAGTAIAFAGVLVLLLERGLRFDHAALGGDLLILAAVLAWALYLHAGRAVTRRHGALLVTTEALVAGTLVYLPIGLVALRGFDPATVTPLGMTGLLYLAWLTSGVNYVVWFWGIEHLRPATVGLVTNLQPPTTALMAWGLLGEPLSLAFLASAALVLGGVWIAQERAAVEPASPASDGP
jgi:drug/metabolite transporter (DMT)-like permease